MEPAVNVGRVHDWRAALGDGGGGVSVDSTTEDYGKKRVDGDAGQLTKYTYNVMYNSRGVFKQK